MAVAAADARETQPTGHGHRDRAGGRRAVAQLAGAVVSPAVRRLTGRETAGVLTTGAGAHRGEGQPAGHGHGDRAGGGRAVAQLAVFVVTPAIRCAAGGET